MQIIQMSEQAHENHQTNKIILMFIHIFNTGLAVLLNLTKNIRG